MARALKGILIVAMLAAPATGCRKHHASGGTGGAPVAAALAVAPAGPTTFTIKGDSGFKGAATASLSLLDSGVQCGATKLALGLDGKRHELPGAAAVPVDSAGRYKLNISAGVVRIDCLALERNGKKKAKSTVFHAYRPRKPARGLTTRPGKSATGAKLALALLDDPNAVVFDDQPVTVPPLSDASTGAAAVIESMVAAGADPSHEDFDYLGALQLGALYEKKVAAAGGDEQPDLAGQLATALLGQTAKLEAAAGEPLDLSAEVAVLAGLSPDGVELDNPPQTAAETIVQAENAQAAQPAPPAATPEATDSTATSTDAASTTATEAASGPASAAATGATPDSGAAAAAALPGPLGDQATVDAAETFLQRTIFTDVGIADGSRTLDRPTILALIEMTTAGLNVLSMDQIRAAVADDFKDNGGALTQLVTDMGALPSAADDTARAAGIAPAFVKVVQGLPADQQSAFANYLVRATQSDAGDDVVEPPAPEQAMLDKIVALAVSGCVPSLTLGADGGVASADCTAPTLTAVSAPTP